MLSPARPLAMTPSKIGLFASGDAGIERCQEGAKKAARGRPFS
jgi:hypothetical protein